MASESKQGWNTRRAEIEAKRIVQQMERRTWVPPRLEPREDRLESAMADLSLTVDESFRVFAKRWWLGYLERFFGRYRLSEITPRVVDRFRDELQEQAEALRARSRPNRTFLEVDEYLALLAGGSTTRPFKLADAKTDAGVREVEISLCDRAP
jgi:hypothetical protein